MSAKPKVIRCAIYTRKSSEEGLEQEFNSLHAQREAGESYVKSQKHEGWEVLPTEYDDGGYSGGNTERPALKRLVADIEAKKVDIVVVYKVDRLSRSLGDFARIIEVFDKYNVSFVSVTQQFNTSTSMGRLTLNVLLSFAQFEREVTGERIRDKFAASKQKGMWLGGFTPLGYDVVNKKLVVNQEEAELVRYIFKRYLVLKSAYHLSNELNRDGIPTKSWINSSEKKVGGKPYTKNRVYKLITNPVYIGKVTHYQRKAVYDGIHEPIIDQVLWDQTQELLQRQQRSRGVPKQSRGTMLVKLLRAQDETPYVPTYTGKPKGKKYNYYRHERTNHRVVANVIERLVVETIREVSPPVPESMTETQAKHRWRALWVCFAYLAIGIQNQIIRQIIEKIICSKTEITIRLKITGLTVLLQSDEIFNSLPPEYDVKNETGEIRQSMDVRQTDEFIDIMMKVNFVVKSGRHYIADADGQILESVHKCEPNQAIIAALAKAHRWKHMIDNGEANGVAAIAKKEGMRTSYVSRLIRLNYLSPKIKTAILSGMQPHTLSLQNLRDSFPIKWEEQERAFGF